MGRIREIELPWTQQPQEAAPIADGYASGMELLVNYGVATSDLLRGRAMTVVGSSTYGASPIGRSIVTPSGGQSGGGYTVGTRGGALPLSLLLVSYISAQGTLCSVADTYYSGDPFLLLSSDASDLRLYTAYAWRTLGSSATGVHIVGLRYDGAVLEVWRNGALIWSLALASLGGDNSADLYVGSGYGYSADAAHALVAYWHRDVGAAAMGALTRNPWDLFAPRRILIPTAAAPAAVPDITFVGAENITSNSAGYRVTLNYA